MNRRQLFLSVCAALLGWLWPAKAKAWREVRIDAARLRVRPRHWHEAHFYSHSVMYIEYEICPSSACRDDVRVNAIESRGFNPPKSKAELLQLAEDARKLLDQSTRHFIDGREVFFKCSSNA